MHNMTEGSPIKVILKFMIPLLLGNFLQLTYTLADTRIIGGFLGDDALAAVGAATVLFNLFFGFIFGAAAGFSIMLSQRFGGKRFDEVGSAFAAALVLGAAFALFIILPTQIFLRPIMIFLQVPPELLEVSLGYIRIVFFGLIITMFYNVLLASARAIGDSLTPLIILMISVGLNIAGDLVLIGYFDCGVRGAAAATVIAQSVALIVCAVYLLKKYDFFRITKRDFELINSSMIKNMLASGVSMGLMSSLINIGSFILQTAINSLGSTYIVAQTAARRLTEVLMSVLIATGQTMATYCGQNIGAGRLDRIRAGQKAGYIITGIWCVIVIIAAYTLSPILVQLITGSGDRVMIDAASLYLRVDCSLYILVAVIMIQRNSLQGMGDRITPLLSSGIEMVGKIILTYTIVPALAYMGVILVEPIVWVVMIIPLIIQNRKITRRDIPTY